MKCYALYDILAGYEFSKSSLDVLEIYFARITRTIFVKLKKMSCVCRRRLDIEANRIKRDKAFKR